MKIYTKTGDKGETSLFGGARITKAHHRIEAYGEVDELNAHIGLAVALEREQSGESTLEKILEPVQQELFVIGAHLATQYDLGHTPDTLPDLNTMALQRLEEQIDSMEEDLPQLKTFILPSGTAAASALHVARTVCRRAERAVVRLSHEEEIRPEIVQYLNRLSDFLFVLSRTVNKNSEISEILWKK